jgi:hypothetical protein
MPRPIPKTSRKRRGGMNPTTLRGRWLIFSSFARMHVRASGGYGPACKPFQHVLQLLIESPADHESWTVYRDDINPDRDGKIVCKKWIMQPDWEKVQKLDGKPLPKDWHLDYSVVETSFPVSSRWLRALDRAVDSLSIPPMTGPILPFSVGVDYQLSLWRSRRKSEFSWVDEAPKGWKPISDFFAVLLENFRKHAQGGLSAKPTGPEWFRRGVSSGRLDRRRIPHPG